MQKTKVLDINAVARIFTENTAVFMSGAFDLLHLGHMRILAAAKQTVGAKGKLVVAVINDDDVRERKGKQRPLFSLNERVEALSYLDSVDFVIPWIEHWTKLRDFVAAVRPDYLVAVEGDSGLDDKRSHIESAGGKFVLLKRKAALSTSMLIEKIRKLR